MEGWARTKTWSGNTGQYGEPSGTQWNLPRRGKETPQPQTLKTQVSKIDSITKKMDSTVRMPISRIKNLTYALSQLCQSIEYLEDLENERSGREEESSLGNPQWMEGIQDKE